MTLVRIKTNVLRLEDSDAAHLRYDIYKDCLQLDKGNPFAPLNMEEAMQAADKLWEWLIFQDKDKEEETPDEA